MIRFIHCVKAKEGIDPAEFRQHFQSEGMQALVQRMKQVMQPTDMKISFTLQLDINRGLMHGRLLNFASLLAIAVGWAACTQVQENRPPGEDGSLGPDGGSQPADGHGQPETPPPPPGDGPSLLRRTRGCTGRRQRYPPWDPWLEEP